MTRPAVSWPALEAYALGLLPPDEAAHVETALAEDPALARRLDALTADARPVPPLPLDLPADSGAPLPDEFRADSGAPLPDEVCADSGAPLPEDLPADSRLPLPVVGRGDLGSPSDAAPPAPARASRLARWRAPVAVGLALAAAALLAVWPAPSTEPPPAEVRYKGGSLALRVDRSRDGVVAEGVASFAEGDGLQLRLTCPPGERPWTAAVFQGGERFAPLDDTAPVSCGNSVRLPGAFSADAGPLTVCVAVDVADPLDAVPSADTEGVVCVGLAAE